MSLARRFLLWLLVGLITAIAVTQIIQYFSSSKKLRGQLDHLAFAQKALLEERESVAANTIFDSIQRGVNDSLERGEMAKFSQLLDGLVGVEGLTRYILFDRVGVAAHSTDRSVLGREMELEAARKVLHDGQVLFRKVGTDFEIYRPIPITPDCRRCHHSWPEEGVGGVHFMAYSTLSLMKSQEVVAHGAKLIQSGNVMGILMAFCILVPSVGLVSWWLIKRLVSHPLGEVIKALEAMAAGDKAGRLGTDGPTELARLSAAVNRTVDDMARAVEEAHAREWLRAGLTGLDERLRGDRPAKEVARLILNYLVETLRVRVGTLYLLEGQALRLASGYAVGDEKRIPREIGMGEGLVGQVAENHKTLVIKELPEGALRVDSSLCQTPPRQLWVVPLLRQDELAGVMELGMLDDLSSREQELIDLCRGPAAAALLSAMARERVALLLEQTQVQSEELRNQQEELQQSNEELEEHSQALERGQEEVRRKNADLEKVRLELVQKAQDLEQASRYKSEFLANMSHELRTPLNSMLILSRLLSDNKKGNLDPKQVEFAKTINKAGSDLLNLINDILDLSKIEAGKMEFHFEVVHLPDLMGGLEQLFRHIAQEKGLGFSVNLDRDAPTAIRTDSQRLQQVLKNLIGNALKFTEKGSVNVHLRCVAKGERQEAGLGVAVDVTDTGIGIPKEHQASVFDAFKQADGSTSRRFGGTGLGLSISRELMHHLGGELCLKSEPGVGSTFTVYMPTDMKELPTPTVPVVKEPVRTVLSEPSRRPHLPKREELPAASPVPSSAVPSAGSEGAGESSAQELIPDDRASLQAGQRAILIVEDDTAFARILMDLVRERGFGALWAGDAVKALELARKYEPTGIFLDVMLPGIDGWAVMRQLKDDPLTRHIPVHFVSCLDRALDGLRMGAVGYLTKPVSVDELQSAISRIEKANARGVRQLLVVEDDMTQANSIVALLADSEVEATIANTGADAIRHLAEKNFDCVVLDLGLTDMSGFDLLEHIRSKAELSRVPVIVYTGRDLSREEENKLRKYAESIIVKGTRSPERLLDEATLFLHLVEENMPEEKQRMIRLAHDNEALLATKKVLLVDDDVRNVFSLTSVLEGLNMEVIPALDGKEALDKLREYPDVNLVLMDIMMPVMDGYDATRAIRAQPQFSNLPIIALTAKAMKGDRDRCIQAGASDYLSKPVDIDQLITLMRVWVDR
jgi:signal transduction histidine kinase/DNA-binding response OmpR family regulator